MKKFTYLVKTVLVAVFAAGIVSANAKPLNNSLNFVNASSNYLSVTTPTNIPIGNSPYTIQAWFYANAMGTYGIVGWGNYGTGNQVNALRLDGSGAIVNYWWGNDLSVSVGDISGAWHNVAVTWDGSTRTMYLDGNVIGSDSPGADNVPNTGNFAVGRTWPGGGEFFDGSLDEVSIWSVALTQAKIRDNMAHGVCSPAGGLALYYNMDMGIAAGNNTGITSVTDLSGNGNFGVLNNFSLTGSTSNFETGVPIVNICPTGIGNTALQFDGVSGKDFVDAGSILPPSYTKECWVYMVSDNGTFNNFISGGDADGMHALGAPGLHLNAGHNGGWGDVNDPAPLNLGQWYHVAVTYDASSKMLTLYKNGVMVAQHSGEPAYANGNEVRIGAYNAATNNGNCIIDEVKIWNYALPAEGIKATMNNALCLPSAGLVAYYTFNNGTAYGDNEGTTAIPDSSGNGNNATAVNFTMWSDTSNFVEGAPVNMSCATANALNFDGVNDYAANFPFSTITDNLTIEARVNWNGPVYSNNEMLVTNGNTSTNGYAIFIDPTNSYNISVVLGSVAVMQSSAYLNPGEWHMVSLTSSNHNWMLYVDGVSYALTSNVMTPNPVSGMFAIGSDQAGNENFNGTMDEVRFWNRALCSSEINHYDTVQLNGTEPGIIALYDFTQGYNGTDNTGISALADVSGNSNNLVVNNFTLDGFTSNFIADPGAMSSFATPFVAPMVNVSAASSTLFCQGDSVVLTADSGSSYLWATGETSQSIVVYGSVKDSVTVTNPFGCYGTSTSAGINVTENMPASVTVSGNVISGFTICSGMVDSLMANATGTGPFTYNWSNSSTNDTALVMPMTNNSYSLVVTDANGCNDTVNNINVTVNPSPSLSLSASNGTTLCAGTNDTLMATASGTGSLTYMWNTGGTNDTVNLSPATTGTYSITVTDNGNGCSTMGTIPVTVNPLPTITITGNGWLGLGLSDTLTASGASTYVWSTGSTSDTTIVAPLTTTTYTVTGTDANGCVDTASFTVNVTPLGVSNISNTASVGLYPNPATEIISLTFNLKGNGVPAVIKVMDEAGREVMTMNTTISNGQVMPVEISTLAAGAYFVRIATNKSAQVVRFVKK